MVEVFEETGLGRWLFEMFIPYILLDNFIAAPLRVLIEKH